MPVVGKNREGNPELIQKEFDKAGKDLQIESFKLIDGIKVSSGNIIKALKQGRVADAGSLLGRPYAVTARVKTNSKRGATVGFKTANQQAKNIIWPKNGVYVTQSLIAGSLYKSVTNVGLRPTFGGDQHLIETYVITEEDLNLYRKIISVRFLDRIRDEIKFDDIKSLRNQIAEDVKVAQNFEADQIWMKI
ncbi:MAG: riboflavin kinase [Bdellovibrionota bacterium]